ncbi:MULTISPECIES: dipeptide epimerase [unclassified Pseudoalteromonas]|uniref:mandelate racemase/muconate lactonizing enzyme family protein n=1 Tax=unclassified Pseudoalteromonas TaxID=194690 RepID=UPI000B3C5AA6|nr:MULTISPECIES: dipeptide epimerase [unclassified Pseudoalteromonas]MDN3379262.1 dipeptide epimerase [Pseudoalteromonas sp. APC 3893]MDN3386436.1 dipeptide epimerase [Pseudoalteromonas sp. APC 4017]OUS71290.1 dipeptide epimerase [Pseudoalteromonas sp. A601]
MKIKTIRFAKLKVPLVTPFKTALREVSFIEDLVIIIETNCGQLGYGSAASTPVITGDTHQGMMSVISQFIAPKLIDREIENINQICQIIQSTVVGNYSAKAALELAVYDLWGKLYQAPLYKLLGGGSKDLRTDITISVDAIDKMLADCQLAVQQGFDILKVKIGNDLQQDIARINAIYQDYGQQAQIRLDVNQGWSAKQTVFALQQLENNNVQLELVEQPVKSDDFKGLKYITERVNTPIMADESAFSPQQVIQLLEQNAVDIINIKVMKTGGLSRAIEIANITAQYQAQCMIGCMLEGSIAVAGAAHLASAKAQQITKIDLDGPALGQYDPVQGGVEFKGPAITLGDAPGLGIIKIDGLQDITDGVWPI